MTSKNLAKSAWYTRKKTLTILLGSLVAAVLLASCFPQPPERTRERPIMEQPGERIQYVAQIEPYMPSTSTTDNDRSTRPITLIVPFLPGGDTNLYARMFAPHLAEILGQPIYVVNVDGASGTVGSEWVRAAMPDGYVMLFYHTGNLFTNVLTGAAELLHTDFEIACIAMHCDANILVVRSDLGINNAAEFLSYARANPGRLNVATTITGFSFKVLRLAEIAGGFRTNPIHVGGGSMMAPSILAGHTEVGYNIIAIFNEYIDTGELIPIWIAADQRNALLPGVPTMAEVGIEGGYMGRSYFFAFPLGTDEIILRRVSEAVQQITENPAFRQELFEITGSPPFFVPFGEASDYLDAMWAQVEGLEISQ
jgi:tripartite-type tricarboxylate transporter receptor subunit TctC